MRRGQPTFRPDNEEDRHTQYYSVVWMCDKQLMMRAVDDTWEVTLMFVVTDVRRWRSRSIEFVLQRLGDKRHQQTFAFSLQRDRSVLLFLYAGV